MRTAHGVVGTYLGSWDEAAVAAWARHLRAQLAAPRVTLGVLFASPEFHDRAADLLETLRLEARIPLLVGSSSSGLIEAGRELEDVAGFTLALHHLPDARLQAVHLTDDDMAGLGSAADWHQRTGVGPGSSSGWLAFAESFHTENEAWLAGLNSAYPGVTVTGGLATGRPGERRSQVYLDGEVHEEGVVLVSVGGRMALVTAVSQGCCPIGDAWTITRAERNFILGIANRPAYSVLVETYNALSAEEQRLCQDNIMVGFASSEYRDEFRAGDFLVRQLIGADPRAGALAVGAFPRPGQTIQFQRRDPATATADLTRVLERTRGIVGGRRLLGGILWSCCGRGRAFFKTDHHDAALVQEHLGPLAVAGGFANGEVGPVGASSFFHGYTASLALFVGA